MFYSMNIVCFLYENFLLIVLGLCFVGYYFRRTSQKLHVISQQQPKPQEPFQVKESHAHQVDENKKLSFVDCCKILESYQFADKRVIPMIAHVMTYATKKECLSYLKVAQELANKDISLISFQHFMTSYLDATHGALRENFTISDEERKKVAFHESGHAIGYIYQQSDFIVHLISIEPREQETGFIIYLPIKESTGPIRVNINWIERKVIIGLGGAVAEQVFGFPDPDGNVINKEKNFDDLLYRMLFQSDFEKVRSHIMHIMFLQNHPVAKLFDKESCTSEDIMQINDAIEEMIKIYYVQTYDFVVKHKDKVEQLAHALLKQETLYYDQIYELLGVVRPQYHFEK